jgi:hypothetical protein
VPAREFSHPLPAANETPDFLTRVKVLLRGFAGWHGS